MASKVGRPKGSGKGVRFGEEHRDKIRKSNIFRYLIDHAEGKREMSQTQVNVGLAMMKKVLPDMSSVQISGDPDQPVQHEHSVSPALEEVASLLSGIAAREREDGDP